jgi:hypothetical protein
MTTNQLISHLNNQGVHLEVKLNVSGKKPDDATLELLKSHKPALINHLTQGK